jgi:two-component system, chemotaxis family, protein-glutamate methylesterase/glutaminase
MTAAGDRVRVLVVDDSPAARAAIGEVVEHVREFELVASAGSGKEALALLPQVEPDLVLLDFRMPDLDGLETSRLIRASGHRAALVLVSVLGRGELPGYVESCGVAAVLDKRDVSPRRLSALWRSLQREHQPAAHSA